MFDQEEPKDFCVLVLLIIFVTIKKTCSNFLRYSGSYFLRRMRLWLCFASQFFISLLQSRKIPIFLASCEFQVKHMFCRFGYGFGLSVDIMSWNFVISVLFLCFTFRFCFIKAYNLWNFEQNYTLQHDNIHTGPTGKSLEASTILFISTPLNRALHSPLGLVWTINQSFAIEQTTN